MFSAKGALLMTHPGLVDEGSAYAESFLMVRTLDLIKCWRYHVRGGGEVFSWEPRVLEPDMEDRVGGIFVGPWRSSQTLLIRARADVRSPISD